MKTKIIYILLGIFLVVTLAACYEDKGNYDYTPLPDIQLENMEETNTITQFDTLKINPDINYAGLSENDFDFSWRMWTDDMYSSTMREISDQKILSYPVKEIPGSYTLVFAMTDKRTGVNVYKNMKVSVQGILSEGWLVLEEKNGKTDFNLIMTPYISTRTTKELIYSDLYEQVNGEVLEGKGVKIVSYYTGGRQWVYVLTENGGVQLSAITMQKLSELSSLVLDGKPLKPENYLWIPYGSWNRFGEVLVSDGRYYINTYGRKQFTEPVFRDGSKYKASPYAPRWIEWTLGAVIYDELQGRFLKVTGQLMTVQAFPPATGALFDWNHMNATLLHMESGFNKYEYAVMQDWTTGKRAMYVFDFLTEEDKYAIALYQTDGCPGFADAKCFAVGGRGNVFYYSTKNKVYLYDFIGTNTASEVLSVPAGEEITHMKIMKPNDDYYMNNHPYDNKVLIFSTYNASTGEGKVYMHYIDESNGVVDVSSRKVFEGFGEILDMDFNWPKYGA